MVSVKSKYYFFILCVFISFSSMAQSHLWGDVSIQKSNVYVGEPVQVTVSVFTSTWFTSGINPGNIKVNDAFTIYFRSLSTSKQIKGKTYAGVQLYFNVFPYDDNDIIFPELEFEVETPDKGGFKGVKRIVKTPSRVIKVKSIPAGFNKSEWLVTTNMTVSENWSGNKYEVKVGDVLERKITRNVANTVAELIPPIIWDSIPTISLYPKRSTVKSNKTKTYISATRTDGVRFLFEKEGTIVIPEKVLTWYNPRSKKLFKRTLKGFSIKVLPNPNLGMLESVRDSLQVTLPIKGESVEEDTPKTILGLTVKQFIVAVCCLILIGYLLFKIGRRVLLTLKNKKTAYLNSEKYYFDQFNKSINKGDSKEIINALYKWISMLNLNEPTVHYFASQFGSNELHQEIVQFDNDIKENNVSKLNTKEWFIARKNYLNQKRNGSVSESQDWVNP